MDEIYTLTVFDKRTRNSCKLARGSWNDIVEKMEGRGGDVRKKFSEAGRNIRGSYKLMTFSLFVGLLYIFSIKMLSGLM